MQLSSASHSAGVVTLKYRLVGCRGTSRMAGWLGLYRPAFGLGLSPLRLVVAVAGPLMEVSETRNRTPWSFAACRNNGLSRPETSGVMRRLVLNVVRPRVAAAVLFCVSSLTAAADVIASRFSWSKVWLIHLKLPCSVLTAGVSVSEGELVAPSPLNGHSSATCADTGLACTVFCQSTAFCRSVPVIRNVVGVESTGVPQAVPTGQVLSPDASRMSSGCGCR